MRPLQRPAAATAIDLSKRQRQLPQPQTLLLPQHLMDCCQGAGSCAQTATAVQALSCMLGWYHWLAQVDLHLLLVLPGHQQLAAQPLQPCLQQHQQCWHQRPRQQLGPGYHARCCCPLRAGRAA